LNLKCIGGDCDGTIIYVDDNIRVGDLVKVYAKIEFKVDTFNEDLEAYRNGRTPDHAVQRYYLYRKAVFNFSKDDKFYFLVDQNMSDKEAILGQFNK
jgi:hypothetical protein